MKALPLTSSEAKIRLRTYGPNRISEEPLTSPYTIFVRQLSNPLILILAAATIATFGIGETVDAVVILMAIIVNSALGFVQEYKAEKELVSLKSFLTPKARVIRDRSVKVIPCAEIVPGDAVILGAGDKIPADGTVAEAVNFFVNEAILTGESVPIKKSATADHASVFMGTTVTSGRATFTVTKTGKLTSLGAIAETLKTTKEPETPLQLQLSQLARSITVAVVFIALLLFVTGIAFGETIVTMFTTAIAVAVAAVPEGMTITLTAILAIGMQRILRRKALVRNLMAAETLGSVTVICADKTGTLTEGVMRAAEINVTNIDEAVKVAVLANNMEDPIEIALWEWARKIRNTDPAQIKESLPRTQEIPFDSNHKYLAVSTGESLWVKGAPEVIMKVSRLSDAKTAEWIKAADAMAGKGLRLIGLAYKKIPKNSAIGSEIHDLEFLGIIGVMDPVRNGVTEAIHLAESARIKIKVITGDYRTTAVAVLSEIGLSITDPEREIMEGAELELLSPDELRKRVAGVTLFCRVSPHHKLKIVEALQANGETVAMTGDGVNDALALKKAEIAIVVENAPDVARDNADIILLDSNLKTIIAAVEEGRGIFANIRKVVLYLMSDAFAEIILILSSLILKLPLPLTASQILWINIISDGFPNLALAFEPKDHSLMNRPPRPKSAPVVTRESTVFIGVLSFIKSIIAILLFTVTLTTTGEIPVARTVAFAAMGTGSLFYIFAIRNLDKPGWKQKLNNPHLILAVFVSFMFQLFPIYHPALRELFHTSPLSPGSWLAIAVSGFILYFTAETVKFIMKRTSWHAS